MRAYLMIASSRMKGTGQILPNKQRILIGESPEQAAISLFMAKQSEGPAEIRCEEFFEVDIENRKLIPTELPTIKFISKEEEKSED